MKMRIAFLSDTIYPSTVGGIERRIHELAKRLSRRHQVYIVGLRGWEGRKKLEFGRLRIHGVAPMPKLFVGERRSIGEALYFALVMSKFVHVLNKEDIDVIDVQSAPYLHYPLLWVLKKFRALYKARLVFTWHDVWDKYWYDYLGKLLGFIGYSVERVVAKLSKHNIAVSPRIKLMLQSLGINEVTIIPNGVDFKYIQRIPAKKDVESDVIYAGRLVREKKVELLVKAISILKKEMKNIKCLIIGWGPKRPYIQKLVKELNLEENVKLIDPILSYRDYIAFLKSSRVFILPSIRESFGIAALEALAAGLPVITFNIPQNAAKDFIIDGVNGYKVQPDPEVLAKYIIITLSSYNAMKSHAIKIASLFDWDLIAVKLENYYKKVLSI